MRSALTLIILYRPLVPRLIIHCSINFIIDEERLIQESLEKISKVVDNYQKYNYQYGS